MEMEGARVDPGKFGISNTAARRAMLPYCHYARHPGGNPGANLESISHRCCLREVAFEWELTTETIDLSLGCLQGGVVRPPAPLAAAERLPPLRWVYRQIQDGQMRDSQIGVIRSKNVLRNLNSHPSQATCKVASGVGAQSLVNPPTQPSTLHPTPYTLHPAPCTLHP